MYYLQTRYYDPEIGRFISPDIIDYLDPETVNGLNLYSYCYNNPLAYADPNGHFVLTVSALIWIGFGVGALIGGASSIVGQGIQNGFDNINWWQVGLDSLVGGISGALSMSSLGLVPLALANGSLSFLGSVGGHLINGSDFSSSDTWTDIAITTILSTAISFISGGGALNKKSMSSVARTTKYEKALQGFDTAMYKSYNNIYKNTRIAEEAIKSTTKCLEIAWNEMMMDAITRNFISGMKTTAMLTFISMRRSTFR